MILLTYGSNIYGRNELIYETEMDSQTYLKQKQKHETYIYQRGKVGRNKLGVWG